MPGILEQENGRTELSQAQDLNSGFVGGTLVHTNKGLISIQNIKIGDLVLSKDQNNPEGGLVYKPVLRTIVIKNIPVYHANFRPESISNLPFSKRKDLALYVDVLCTANYSFWVENKGWIPANEMLMNDKVVLKNNELARFIGGDLKTIK